MNLTQLLEEYKKAQPKRSTGGVNALSGFDFQIRCYLADFVEGLASSNRVRDCGEKFVGALEAMSDYSTYDDGLVFVQAKKSLNVQTMVNAAVEFCQIELFRSRLENATEIPFRYRVIGSRSTLAHDWTWEALRRNRPKQIETSQSLKTVFQSLVDANRLDPPRVDADPWWRLISSCFEHLDRPFEFARHSLDICLSRSSKPATDVRDQIVDLYTRHVRDKRGSAVLALDETDFAPVPSEHLLPLQVGVQPSIEHLCGQQYMRRSGHVQNAIRELSHDERSITKLHRIGLPVFWITGASGSGKSVLLLQIMELMVSEGERVLWLRNDAAKLVGILREWVYHANTNDREYPQFIFIDDLYAPANQDSLDLSELANLVSENPNRHWPTIVTCGPPEYYAALNSDSDTGVLNLRDWKLPGVQWKQAEHGSPTEAEDFVAWFQARTGEPATSLPRVSSRDGLIISMAFDLKVSQSTSLAETHGQNFLKSFAKRFRMRLERSGLNEALVLPLALNRLYLACPANWLTERDRESLELINSENEFSFFDLADHGEVFRLTHPHISDAIYKAIRWDHNHRGYATDLADVLRIAADSNPHTFCTLLGLFSDSDDRTQQRLQSIDWHYLAKRVADDWKADAYDSCIPKNRLANVRVSLACWNSQMPELKLEARFGYSFLDSARLELEKVGNGWHSLWQRLWKSHGDCVALFSDALEWLHLGKTAYPRGWSKVWQGLINSQLTGTWEQQELLRLGFESLPYNQDKVDWSYVWEHLMDTDQLPADVPRTKLVQIGIQWLEGREESLAWNYVWQYVLDAEVLPEGISRTLLLDEGYRWLRGRENNPQWNYVWQKLMHESNSLDRARVDELLRVGADWLDGREQDAGWSRIWEKLIDSIDASTTLSRDDLLIRGSEWLFGREEESDWNFVWQRLIAADGYPSGVDRQNLLDTGVRWLETHTHLQEWNYVWQGLMKATDAFAIIQRTALIEMAQTWLLMHRDSKNIGWACVAELWLEFEGNDQEVCEQICNWILTNPGERRNAARAARLLATCEPTQFFSPLAQWLAVFGSANTSDGDVQFAYTFLRCVRASGKVFPNEQPGWTALLGWLDGLTAPINENEAKAVKEFKEKGLPVRGTIVEFAPGAIVVQLANPKILAILPTRFDLTSRTLIDATKIGSTVELEIDAVRKKGSSWQVVLSWSSFRKSLEIPSIQSFIQNRSVGDRVRGRVLRLVKFGAIVEADGATGLLHATNMTWARRTSLNAIVNVGQELELVVVELDPMRSRISFGLKQLSGDPWDFIGSELRVGDKVSGTIERFEQYGIFVQVRPGVVGLLHVSDIQWQQFRGKLKESFSIGDTIECKILAIDTECHKLSLGMKQLTQDPLEKLLANGLQIGKRYQGEIARIAPYGLFVVLPDGVEGLVHRSQIPILSRNNRSPFSFFAVGQRLEVLVRSIDRVKRQIELSLGR